MRKLIFRIPENVKWIFQFEIVMYTQRLDGSRENGDTGKLLFDKKFRSDLKISIHRRMKINKVVHSGFLSLCAQVHIGDSASWMLNNIEVKSSEFARQPKSRMKNKELHLFREHLRTKPRKIATERKWGPGDGDWVTKVVY